MFDKSIDLEQKDLPKFPYIVTIYIGTGTGMLWPVGSKLENR